VETSSQVGQAVDGNPSGTTWVTEHYDSDTFAGTKLGPDPGVGIYVQTSSPARPHRMEVRSETPGWDAQVFAAASGPPEGIEDWGEPVGQIGNAQGNQTIPLKVTKPSKYFLLWFTKASPAADQPDRYQVSISDIKLVG
jgi:hypothetical protein